MKALIVGMGIQGKKRKEILGKEFITLYTELKQTEHDAYQKVISAWEREHLLLNV